jgi:plastocyanin
MAKTTRRNLLKVVAAGGVSAALGVAIKTETRAQQSPDEPEETQSHGNHDKPVSGPLAQATISFGQYPADSTVDRMRVANPGSRNTHQLIPNEVKIQAGGTVDFIIEGFHQVVVYDNGTQPDDINPNMLAPAPLNALIDDPNRRIYRGLSPAGVPANFFGPGVPAAAIPAPSQDRVESVSFPNPGTYLVICAVVGHFLDGMFGFVRVLP